MIGVAVEQVWSVTIKHPDINQEFKWTPQVVTLQGKPYFNLSKWDRSLAKCLLKGKGLRTTAGHANSINVPFIDVLARARQVACNSALQRAMHQTEDVPAEGRKRKRQRASNVVVATRAQSQLLPHTVNVSMDGFNDTGGVVEPLVMAVLTKDFKTQRVWVELTADNLQYVVRIIAHQVSMGVRGRRHKRDGNGDDAGPVEQAPEPVELVDQPAAGHAADECTASEDIDDEGEGSETADDAEAR
jgi:hypothetical protein